MLTVERFTKLDDFVGLCHSFYAMARARLQAPSTYLYGEIRSRIYYGLGLPDGITARHPTGADNLARRYRNGPGIERGQRGMHSNGVGIS